jgi:hypothetical protein
VSIRARHALIAGLILGSALLVGACSGAAAPSQSSAAPPAGNIDTSSTEPNPPAGGGAETVKVVITGGPDAGTYTTSADPLCSHNIFGKGGWGTQYSTADLTGDKDFTSLQLATWEGDPDPEGMFSDTKFLMSVTIGPMTGGRTYDVKVMTDASGEESQGQGSATVQQGNPTVITATGTTANGEKIDATVTCPSVTGG